MEFFLVCYEGAFIGREVSGKITSSFLVILKLEEDKNHPAFIRPMYSVFSGEHDQYIKSRIFVGVLRTDAADEQTILLRNPHNTG